MLKNLLTFLSKNLLAILWGILSVLYPYSFKPTDCVVVMDVGQGDSILIQKGRYQVIIDGGPDISLLYSLPKYIPLDDREIEVVILTHPHDDHIKGILELLKRYTVKELWLYPVCFNNQNYTNLLNSGVDIRYIYSGLKFEYLDIKMDILWPKQKDFNSCYTSWDGNINNDSVVIGMEYLNRSFLFMGDAEMPVEKGLLDIYGEKLKSNVLKVGHHCSKSSSSETFIKMVEPDIAICSCSRENKFGHPDRGTVEKFLLQRVQVFNTYSSHDLLFR